MEDFATATATATAGFYVNPPIGEPCVDFMSLKLFTDPICAT